eukprot:Polyplicarium_translucidae@DN958_c0_g1_i2.p1
MQLSLDVQVPPAFGGLGRTAVVIDTEGSFVVERLQQMAHGVVDHLRRLADHFDTESARTACADCTVDKFLEGVQICRAFDHLELSAAVLAIDEHIGDGREIGLVVVDSISAPFRAGFVNRLNERGVGLLNLANELNSCARRRDVAVAVTNQMTTRLGEDGSLSTAPALGNAWGHVPSTRVQLVAAGPHRIAKMTKSCLVSLGQVPFAVTADGTRDEQ